MSFFQEFKSFAVKGNVMDLAVGVIIGGAFGKIVTSMVDDIIMPIVGSIFGNLEPALHAHVLPRFADEPQAMRTANPWGYDWSTARRFDADRDGALLAALRERRALPFTLVNDLAFPGAGQALTADDGTKSVARFIEQFPVEGPIRLDQDNVRTYPYGPMAAHVLGYVKDTDMLPDNVDDISEVRVESMQKLRYTGKTGAAGAEHWVAEIEKVALAGQ